MSLSKILKSAILSTMVAVNSISADPPTWSIDKLENLTQKGKESYIENCFKNYYDNHLQFIVSNENEGYSYGSGILLNPEENIFLAAYHTFEKALKNDNEVLAFGIIDGKRKCFKLEIEDYIGDSESDVLAFKAKSPLDSRNKIDISPLSDYSSPKAVYFLRVLGATDSFLFQPAMSIMSTKYQFKAEPGMSGAPLINEDGEVCGLVTGFKYLKHKLKENGNYGKSFISNSVVPAKEIRRAVNLLKYRSFLSDK